MGTGPELQAIHGCRLVIESVCGFLGVSATVPVRGLRDRIDALTALDLAEAQLLGAMRVEQSASADRTEPVGGQWDIATGLLADIRFVRAELQAVAIARQRSLMTQVAEGIARLRDIRTFDDLAESIPMETCQLGYDRAMFSFVDREHWVPRATWGLSDTQEARQILDAGSPPYVHVRDLMEVDVVRSRTPILVTDCEVNPRMHPRIWPVSQSKTYVAAPVVARKRVAAMVHLDRNVESGTNDDFDRDLLAVFCQGVGVVLDRLLDARRGAMQDDADPVSDWQEALTSREHEVLRLVAAGLTNAQISNRLFIGHETTKTHVKRLMRKLGVRTRTQASAIFHEAHRSSEREIHQRVDLP